MNRAHKKAAVALTVLLSFSLTIMAAGVPKELPDPDGKPADMSRPVQVYILMGQSNMLGAGKDMSRFPPQFQWLGHGFTGPVLISVAALIII